MYPSVQSDTAYKIIDKEGDRRYELANHLGNVLAVISDRKTGLGNGTSYISFEAITISATDYFPFGMSMPGRSFTAANTEGYRYSFNGKEDDTEWAKQDYGMRIYDKRIGKFLSVDPLTAKYPELTPYQFASNTPVQASDLDGAEADFSSAQVTKWEYASDDKAYHSVSKFAANTVVSVWNGVVGTVELGVNITPGYIPGNVKVANDAINTVKAVYDWTVNTTGDQKLTDIKNVATNPHTYEDIAAILLTRKISKAFGGKAPEVTKKKSLSSFKGQALSPEEAAKIKGGANLPKPPKGRGSVEPSKRDPKRLFTKKETDQMLQSQGGKCAVCDGPKTVDEVHGHHVQRHADGGSTTTPNGAAVCHDCHKALHK